MATTYVFIQKIVVGSGGVATIDLTSIPSTYNDLLLWTSLRTSRAAYHESMSLSFNGSSTSLYNKRIYGVGLGGAAATTSSTVMYGGQASGATSTASTFGISSTYIKDYSMTTKYKTSLEIGLSENNAADVLYDINANAWLNNSAISRITLTPENGGTIQEFSTAYLYGISNS
jgi:hypothetical protein